MDITRDIASAQYQTEDFSLLLDDLITEITTRNYRITRINHIDNIHNRREAGIDVTIAFKYYKIVEFCLNSCSELIDVTIAFLKPTAFAALYNSNSLTRAAVDLEQDMTDILDEMGY